MNKSTTKTVSVRFPAPHADLLERAAKAANLTVSDYLLKVVVPWAASDLKEPVPVLPEPARPVKRSPVSLAAAQLGMPRDRFRQLAAEKVAAEMLAQAASGATPVPPKVAKPSGFYRRSA